MASEKAAYLRIQKTLVTPGAYLRSQNRLLKLGQTLEMLLHVGGQNHIHDTLPKTAVVLATQAGENVDPMVGESQLKSESRVVTFEDRPKKEEVRVPCSNRFIPFQVLSYHSTTSGSIYEK